MSKSSYEKLMLTEQILEVRYSPSGSFLDLRGYIADYIRNSGFLSHWKIDTNIVEFRDNAGSIQKESAFAGFRRAGYSVYNPETKYFFVDRASLFWKTFLNNKQYTIPPLERFGARAKVFLPSTKTFEEINQYAYQILYTENTRSIIGGLENDCQFIIELKDQGFDGRISGGPIHKDEAGQYLNFESKEFSKAGFFFDIDFFRTNNLRHDDIHKLLRAAVELTWNKVENLAATIGV